VNKFDIRKKIINLRRRKNIYNYEIKKKLLKNIKKIFFFKNKIVAGYFPINHEISILEILKYLEKKNKIVFPKIKNKNQMEFYPWDKFDFLTVNYLGIPEPNFNKKKEYPDIMFIPMVAFDQNKNRLGYGGGFYDRYIKKIEKKKRVIKIGCAFSFQKINKLPINYYDKKLDFILTEKEII
tara:strand:+ start:2300 stop:2842 length:543 start_codon:yes stop_codon:yes gene_type:complete